jgi:hypothetical protein
MVVRWQQCYRTFEINLLPSTIQMLRFFIFPKKLYLSLDLDDTIKTPDLLGDGCDALSLAGLVLLK